MSALMEPPAAQLVFDLEAAMADVALQRRLDRSRGNDKEADGRGSGRAAAPLPLVIHRMRAFLDALALADDSYPQRQAAVEMAAAATEYAARLPRPTLPRGSHLTRGASRVRGSSA